MEVWEKRRDLYASADLWSESLGRKWRMDANTLSGLLDRPAGSAQHFVVRHTTTQELLGFAATFVIVLGSNKVIGSLALLLVKPTHRDLGIGLSLHDVAVRHLRNIPGISTLQLGSIFPRIFPGLPLSLPAEDTVWFSHRGWKLESSGLSGGSSDNIIRDLYLCFERFTFTAGSSSLSRDLAAQSITISNCAAGEQFEELLRFEERWFGELPGWVAMFERLRDEEADALVATKEGEVVGAALVYTPEVASRVARDIPWPGIIGERVGGMGFVGVRPEYRNRSGVRKGLIVAAILELKQRGLKGCFVGWADDWEVYTSLGFTEWGRYREVWRKI